MPKLSVGQEYFSTSQRNHFDHLERFRTECEAAVRQCREARLHIHDAVELVQFITTGCTGCVAESDVCSRVGEDRPVGGSGARERCRIGGGLRGI